MINVDAISGNEVPPGALPKEVRDDVPIAASEGEYVLPADVVRYIGLQKIEDMVNKAKKDIEQLSAGGRIGGEQGPPPEAEMAPPQEAPMPVPMPQMRRGGVVKKNYNQGGMVASGGGSQQVVPFYGPNGRVMFIPMMNGQPMIPIPEGYTQEQTGQQVPQQQTRPQSRPQRNNSQRQGSTPVNQWSPQQFVDWGSRQGTIGDNVARGLMRAMPLGGLLTSLADAGMRQAPEFLDNMIETGVDRQGNAIDETTMADLIRTRETMRDRLSEESGARPNPFQRVSDFVSDIFSSRQGQGVQQGQPKPAPSGQRRSSGFSSSAKETGTTGTYQGQPIHVSGQKEKDTMPQYGKGGFVKTKPEKTARSGFLKRNP